MFCPKCGREVMENAKFCPGCGEPVSKATDPGTPKQTEASADFTAVVHEVNGLAKKLSLSKTLLGVCAGMALIFLYYLFNYLGAWRLTFSSFLSNLAVPGLFVALILMSAKSGGNRIFIAVPFALKGIMSVLDILRVLFTPNRSMSLQGWLVDIAHIALAALFLLAIMNQFNGKMLMVIISGAAAAAAGGLAFKGGILGGVMLVIYFASVLLLIMEFDFSSASFTGRRDPHTPSSPQ